MLPRVNVRRIWIACCAFVFMAYVAAAADDPSSGDMGHQHHDMSAMPGMEHSHEKVPLVSIASGTALQPASTPVYMWMEGAGGWTFMQHGELFLTYNQQGGPRGAGKLESENWLMTMEQHRLGHGTLEFRQMVSAEPLTIPHGGSPELFQTGETYQGRALVDHQHPHDVFGELALYYELPLSEKISWEFYGGPAGEPALGPVAFLHRASASENPAAPLSHHLQDSTHIAYGVVTTGMRFGFIRAEASVFNGREPDERRYKFDFAPMESWSARLSASPARNWTAQYSYGHLVQPEALEFGNVNRQTASLGYNRPLPHGNWATTVVWGRNRKLFDQTTQNGFLLESTLNFLDRNYAYTRLELLDRDELFPYLPPPLPSYRVGAFTFGGVRDLIHNRTGQIGVGADVTLYSKPVVLDTFYGQTPLSFHVFLRFRPGRMNH